MLGLMQNQPLLISSLIDFADRHHGDGEIVSRRVEGDIHRYNYKDLAARSRQVANALDESKIGFGDRVATLAWNGYRHLELYFGVSGSGRVLHTLNPRLHPDQVVWIANHAEDQILCFDASFLPIVQAVHARCTTIKHYVMLCDADKLPQDSGIPNLSSYETWIGQQSNQYNWPAFDENSYGAVPPLGVITICPLHKPLQVTLVGTFVNETGLGSVTLNVICDVHKFASVTVAV